MLRLSVLGSIELIGPEGGRYQEFLAKPKRVGLLVYLALARPRGLHRRDTLATLFWPELDQESARRALRQGLHVIRHDLLPGLLIGRGDEEIGLAPEQLWCDALELEADLDRGEPARALDRYRGDFLAGFHLPHLPELERWIEDERTRLRGRAVAAARLAGRDAPDPATAAVWLRRALALAPDDELLGRELIGALERSGDRTAALRTYDEIARRLRADLDVEPSAETEALAARLRRAGAAPPPPTKKIRPGPSVRTPSREPAPGRFRPRLRWVGVALAAGAILGSSWILRANGRAPAAPVRLVVLPFANLGAPSTEYFADGLTAEITTRLARVAGLAVMAPGTAVEYKRSTRPAVAIGKELGVGYVLEGTVRWDSAGGTSVVRVNPQLLRVSDATYLWAEAFQRPLTGLFGLQSEIAERVAEALEVNLAQRELRLVREPPTRSAEAHGYYLRAREQYDQVSGRWDEAAGDLMAASRSLERAVELDSGFSLAWAELARVRLTRWRSFRNDQPLFEAARRAAERALAIDPGLPEALLAMALVDGEGAGPRDRAERLLAEAIRRQPSNPEALTELAWVHARAGRWDAAVEAIDQAVELDPGSAGKVLDQGILSAWAGRTSQALAAYRRALALNPDNPSAYHTVADILVNHLGDSVGSAAILDEAERRFGRRGLFLDPCFSCLMQNWWGARYADLIDSIHLDEPEAADSADLYWARGRVAWLAGDRARARAAWDSARSVAVARARARPFDAELQRNAGYLELQTGRKEEGFRMIAEAQRLERERGSSLPMSRAGEWAYALVMAGDLPAAIDSFALALRDPRERMITRHTLRYDPRLAELRRLPRFRSLMAP